MIKRIIRFSAENKYLVVAATIVAIFASIWTMKHIPLDALPDLSDTQVIVYSRWDRSPDIIEDQVTYPITAALLGAPKVKAIRGFSDFGFSYVYVIFEDGTDLYWARTRVLEYLSKITAQLPQGVKVELGPDASSVGWVFQYALVDRTGQHSSDELRSFQDWFLRYAVQSVPGVSEVATVGGQVRQYQVNVNPNSLAAYKLPLDAVIDAVRQGNNDVGGRLVELSGREYMVRGRGYVKGIADLEQLVLRSEGGTPVTIKDVATVSLGPEMRRGIADLDGEGDVVGGIVVMRAGENALNVIERVKKKLEEVKPSLPAGVEVVTTYDRSELIDEAISTVKRKLIEEMIVVSIIILIFLWHFPSAIIPIVTIPVSVALSFIPMYGMGLNANLMSLAGIAISIGVLVDGAIVEVENAYNKIYHWQADGRKGDFHKVRLEALLEVGPGVFFSLLVIAVAFMPVFTLVDQEGRLFRPLAYSKNLAMAIAAILAITLDPAMRMMFARIDPFTFKPRWLAGVVNRLAVGKYYSEEKHPISSLLHRIYEPPARFVLRHPKATIAASLAAGPHHHPGLPVARLRVHAAAARGDDPLHALGGGAGHVGGRGAEGPPGPGQDPEDLPRGRARLRQGGARQHLHGPGAVHDDGDHHHPQARGAVARRAALVLLLGPGRRSRRSCARSGATGSRRTTWRTRWTPRSSSPGSPTPGRCRSRGASTCSRPASGRRSGSRSAAPTSPPSSGSPGRPRRPSRRCPAPAAPTPSGSPAATSSTSS